MSVTDRIDDARVLYSQGRRHGSLLAVLIAVTATARTRFPPTTPSRTDPSKPMGDIEAFTTFLHEELGKMNVPLDRPLRRRRDRRRRRSAPRLRQPPRPPRPHRHPGPRKLHPLHPAPPTHRRLPHPWPMNLY